MKIDASIYRDLSPIEDPNTKGSADVDKSISSPIGTNKNSAQKSSIQITGEAKELLRLQNEIAKMPEVDKSKVMAAKIKLAQGEIGILSDTDARLEAAEKIVDKLIDIESRFKE